MTVLLAVLDGLRPDAIPADFGAEYRRCRSARTVVPSDTLPAHLSLFQSVPPERHGVCTNVYSPPARAVDGICEQAARFGRRAEACFDWAPLRDLWRPGSVTRSFFFSAEGRPEAALEALTGETARCLDRGEADFVFLHLDLPDAAGHRFGWMTEPYLRAAAASLEAVRRLTEGRGCRVLLLGDHGGHGRTHGTGSPEDCTIPVFCRGPEFPPGEFTGPVSILDLAPTAAGLLGLPSVPDWEGRSLLGR